MIKVKGSKGNAKNLYEYKLGDLLYCRFQMA